MFIDAERILMITGYVSCVNKLLEGMKRKCFDECCVTDLLCVINGSRDINEQ